MSDGAEYPWVKGLEDNYWHKRPVTDEPKLVEGESEHTYHTICGLDVYTAHVSQVPPHETRQVYAYSHEHGCRKCLWLENWEPMIELMARNAHEAWMATNLSWGIASRIADWGEEFMVPYDDLSEKGKELDRTIMRSIFMSIYQAGYRVRKK